MKTIFACLAVGLSLAPFATTAAEVNNWVLSEHNMAFYLRDGYLHTSTVFIDVQGVQQIRHYLQKGGAFTYCTESAGSLSVDGCLDLTIAQ